jgi:hypothetical protein
MVSLHSRFFPAKDSSEGLDSTVSCCGVTLSPVRLYDVEHTMFLKKDLGGAQQTREPILHILIWHDQLL